MPDIARPDSEADLLHLLGRELKARLPESWNIGLTAEPKFGRYRPDARLRITGPDGVVALVLVEAKTTLNARDVPGVLIQLQQAASIEADAPFGPPLVVSRYIAPRSQQLLAEAGASYMDATGNLRLMLERPAIYLETTGASRDPWRGPERETRTLRGKPAARVVRALVDFKPPFGVRALSKLSDASLGSTYRTVDFLEKEALITRAEGGEIVEVNWSDLLLRWSEDYSFQGSNQITTVLEPRGPERVLDKLRGSRAEYAITGALSARRVTALAAPRLAAIFTPDPGDLAESLGLHQGDAANVLLARPFDDVVFARSEVAAGVRYAALSQTAADLLTGPGRDPAEGKNLIEWMSANEADWRG